MAIGVGRPSVGLEELMNKVSEYDIVHYYFGVNSIPCIISSPLRADNHPSFGFYSLDGKKIYWVDLATKDRGGIFDLLGKYWGESYNNVIAHVWEDSSKMTNSNNYNRVTRHSIVTARDYSSYSILECKVREWKDYDIEYWGSYGITKEAATFADIYPISHKIVIKNGTRMVFAADKYAYAYVEHKEGKVTLKIYQPFNTRGFKWSNNHDRSVISLWTKIPEYGEKVIIAASMKDALCLWSNTGIPAIAVQGEGYGMSNTAINELRRRYKHVYILFDNDEAGLADGKKLSLQTGFNNLILPYFEGGKDVSDLYKQLNNKEEFKEIILSLF